MVVLVLIIDASLAMDTRARTVSVRSRAKINTVKPITQHMIITMIPAMKILPGLTTFIIERNKPIDPVP